MRIIDSPKCNLYNHPTQPSTHWFFQCPQALLAWQLMTEITSDSLHPHQFSLSTAILNIPNLQKNNPLILLTNLTRQIIDKAHSSSNNIHPNTVLHKIYHQSNIFSHSERERESELEKEGEKRKKLLETAKEIRQRRTSANTPTYGLQLPTAVAAS